MHQPTTILEWRAYNALFTPRRHPDVVGDTTSFIESAGLWYSIKTARIDGEGRYGYLAWDQANARYINPDHPFAHKPTEEHLRFFLALGPPLPLVVIEVMDDAILAVYSDTPQRVMVVDVDSYSLPAPREIVDVGEMTVAPLDAFNLGYQSHPYRHRSPL